MLSVEKFEEKLHSSCNFLLTFLNGSSRRESASSYLCQHQIDIKTLKSTLASSLLFSHVQMTSFS